ncbi:permease for cytosine/purines, uracil, thiamine, allantoin-domain-containing protein [Tricladium varicosporioides]|nr:permease for cytosine/purines, uracil, thiamine, allantoin-domain-containing protein [Hymenoscyphus varicosporioides]
MNSLRERASTAKQNAKRKTKVSGWVLPKETTSFSPPGTWTNKDMDVTPMERRTWSSWTMLFYWFSDILTAQSWERGSSVIEAGLTWREALITLIMGIVIITIPMVFNGAIGAKLHVPFPVAARSAFGYVFARFAVCVRLATALFWHSIQTYSGSTAMAQMIRAIWPSYLNIPNHLPTSAGITTQGLFPFCLIAPHKMKWFFKMKVVVVLATCIGTLAAMLTMAKGKGDLWAQETKITGSTRSWLIMTYMMSMAGGWSTMATNIPDFTRYLQTSQGTYWQAVFVPILSTTVAIFGMVCTSCAKVVYGKYIWSPLDLAAEWTSPGGRAAAFFVGFSWAVAQIGVNVSANIVSASNDMSSLCPKYINLRRGAILTTLIGAWAMVPWKVVYSALSFLNFMSALTVFLSPCCALLAADFWIVKKRNIDIPSLYRPDARYKYHGGFNWRAVLAILISAGPNMPGLVYAVNSKINIGGAIYIYDMNFLYGFASAFLVYISLSWAFPAKETLLDHCICTNMCVDKEVHTVTVSVGN